MKYAHIIDGYVQQVVESSYPQEGFELIDFDIPPAPNAQSRFHAGRRAWEPLPEADHELLAAQGALLHRGALLAASDWTQLPDVPLDTKTAWAAYRQALRDITTQPGYPLDIEWPVAP